MGTLQFLLPPELNGLSLDELKRAYFAGGPEGLPYFSEVTLQPGKLIVSRRDDESGFACVPWKVEEFGTLMSSTATLIERPAPYPLVLELARGKVNQLRNQAADWQYGGLQAPSALQPAIHGATMSFARAVARAPSVEATQLAETAISEAYSAAEQLIAAYVQQVFHLRHQRQARLDTNLGCTLGAAIPTDAVGATLRETFNAVCLPLKWAHVEPEESNYQWEAHDKLLDWAVTAGFHVVGGALIDFSQQGLPAWFQRREKSLAGIAGTVCNYAANVIKRYRGRIRTWQLTAGANSASILGLSEEEMMWLTLRVAETARQSESNVELIVGISQPWGEYLSSQPRTNSPFVFADMLVRSGLNLAGLNLEMVMGVSTRGSYCRDLLDASRLIDLYSLLGLPLQITLGFPSHAEKDKQASPDLTATAGNWRDSYSPQTQAEWAEAFTRLVLCKPGVRTVLWTHLDDREPHVFPACGLVDANGSIKPAMQRLAQLRAEHLR